MQSAWNGNNQFNLMVKKLTFLIIYIEKKLIKVGKFYKLGHLARLRLICIGAS